MRRDPERTPALVLPALGAAALFALLGGSVVVFDIVVRLGFYGATTRNVLVLVALYGASVSLAVAIALSVHGSEIRLRLQNGPDARVHIPFKRAWCEFCRRFDSRRAGP